MSYAIFRNKHIEKLEQLIDSEYETVSVPLKLEVYAKYRNCYDNVEQKIRDCGGKMQYGWVLAENKLMCEAEHHAVWENSKGELIDITPAPSKAKRILFIPDDRIIYDGQVIDNVRINITDNPVVDDFIKIAEMDSIIIASGERREGDRVRLSKEASELLPKYRELGAVVGHHAMQGGRQNDPCICNSGKTYIQCHGMGLRDTIEMDKRSLPFHVITLFGS